MINEPYAQITGTVDVAPPIAMRAMIFDLAAKLREVSGEIIATADQMHIPQVPSGLGSAGKEAVPPAQSWVDDMRETTAFALKRADLAMREMNNIRNTIGL